MMTQNQPSLPVIPAPREFKFEGAYLDLDGARWHPVNMSYAGNLEPIGRLLQDMLPIITCEEIKVKANKTSGSNYEGISLAIDANLPVDQYKIHITDDIAFTGGSMQALHWAAATFLQLLERAGSPGTPWRVPRCTITDAPAYPYIGLLVDLARRWHPIRAVERCIVLCWWYKVKYLHLHFTDNQSFTLPSAAFPKLATRRRHYTKEEITRINRFALDHGVTIVPEIDLPGHSRSLVRAYPKLFGLAPFRLGRPVNAGVANIGKEDSIVAISKIIEETCGLFPDSPFFHLGADEVNYEALSGDPDVAKRMEKRGLKDVQELYREFIVRMDDVVRSCGKQMCVWEGFGPSGTVPIPKSIPVFVFESAWNTADQLVSDGYRVVNASWQPIYVTRKHNWTPEQIHAWHPRRWENWNEHSKAFSSPITIEPTPLLLGAEMCSWSQEASMEIPSLRERLAAFVDKTWSSENARPFNAFATALAVQDAKLERILQAAFPKT